MQIINKKLDQLLLVESKVEKIELQCVNIAKSQQFYEEEVSDLKKTVQKQEQEIKELKGELEQQKRINAELKHRSIDLESRSRRDNLVFYNIQDNPQETDSESERKLQDFLVKELKLPKEQVQTIKLDRVHRINTKTRHIHGRATPRPIIAKFNFYKDREVVRTSARNLRGTHFGISEDFPDEIRQVRKRLYPVMKAAKKDNKRESELSLSLLVCSDSDTAVAGQQLIQLQFLFYYLQHVELSSIQLANTVCTCHSPISIIDT
ncbi:myosin-6-like [Ptychodera flava]|uniref:myosin-6-like n=1 Tax=Ptychodera flava TaxID=63121 RepID=UPI00396A67BC